MAFPAANGSVFRGQTDDREEDRVSPRAIVRKVGAETEDVLFKPQTCGQLVSGFRFLLVCEK